MDREAKAVTEAAKAAEAAGLADEALPTGTRLRVEGLGVGTYVRFSRNTMGANDHIVRFGTVGEQVVRLKGWWAQGWSVVPYEMPLATTSVRAQSVRAEKMVADNMADQRSMDMDYLRRFYQHTPQGAEASRDWDVGRWSEEDWDAKFDEIIAFYTKKAKKAAKKGKAGAEADYQEMMYGGIKKKYCLDPRTLPEPPDAGRSGAEVEAEAAARAAQMREKLAAKKAETEAAAAKSARTKKAAADKAAAQKAAAQNLAAEKAAAQKVAPTAVEAQAEVAFQNQSEVAMVAAEIAQSDRLQQLGAHQAQAQATQVDQGAYAGSQAQAEPLEVDAWLSTIGLPDYAPQIKQYGYDRMPALYEATEADIVDMTEDDAVGMKKPHRRLFLSKWKDLASVPNAVQAAGGSGTLAMVAVVAAAEPEPEPEPEAEPLATTLDKYIAADKQIRLGKGSDAAHGIKVLLGVSDTVVAVFLAPVLPKPV